MSQKQYTLDLSNWDDNVEIIKLKPKNIRKRASVDAALTIIVVVFFSIVLLMHNYVLIHADFCENGILLFLMRQKMQ